MAVRLWRFPGGFSWFVIKTLAAALLFDVIYLSTWTIFSTSHLTGPEIIRGTGGYVRHSDGLKNSTTSVPALAERYKILERTEQKKVNVNNETTKTLPQLGKIGDRSFKKIEQLESWLEILRFCEKPADFLRYQVKPSNMSEHAINYCAQLPIRQNRFYAKSKVKVNNFTHVFLKDGRRICDSDTDVLILVHSYHDYFDKRTAIRETWGRAAKTGVWPGATFHEKVKVVFVFGVHNDSSREELLDEESMKYRDIIQGNFGEDYQNMTLKNLLGLKWTYTYCPSIRYLVKSDDDMFINFPAVANTLSSLKNSKNWITGPLNHRSMVHRVGKWAVNPDKFPFNVYPPYESGSAYVISADLIKPLFRVSEYVPHIFIDDVYVTGILAKMVKANHVLKKGFAYATTKMATPCDMMDNKKLTATRMTLEIMTQLWDDIVKRNRVNCKIIKKT